jgi:hypothetical protein
MLSSVSVSPLSFSLSLFSLSLNKVLRGREEQWVEIRLKIRVTAFNLPFTFYLTYTRQTISL